jgi:hypothetical protein
VVALFAQLQGLSADVASSGVVSSYAARSSEVQNLADQVAALRHDVAAIESSVTSPLDLSEVTTRLDQISDDLSVASTGASGRTYPIGVWVGTTNETVEATREELDEMQGIVVAMFDEVDSLCNVTSGCIGQ